MKIEIKELNKHYDEWDKYIYHNNLNKYIILYFILNSH